MAKADLTAQRLRELLHYDSETGETDEATVYKSEIRGRKPAKKVGGKPRLYEGKSRASGVGTSSSSAGPPT